MHLALLVLALAGDPTTASDVKKEAAETVETAAKYASEKKEDFEARMEVKLKTLKERLDEFRKTSATDAQRAKAEVQKKVAELEKKEAEAQKRLSAVKSASAKAWKSMKTGAETAVKDLEEGLR